MSLVLPPEALPWFLPGSPVDHPTQVTRRMVLPMLAGMGPTSAGALPTQVVGQGVEPFKGEGGGWYVQEADGRPYLIGGMLPVWDSFVEAYANRRIGL